MSEMTEEQIIQSLADELEADKAQDEQEEHKEEQSEPEQDVEPEQKEPDKSTEIMSKLSEIEERLKAKEADKETPKSEAPVENEELERVRAELGLAGLKEKVESQEAFIQQEQAKMQEQARILAQQKTFNDIEAKLKEEFPLIKPDDFVKFAKDNGFFDGDDMALNPQEYKSWKLIGMAMTNLAAPQGEPDPITSSSGGKSDLGAFEKLKKGESVDDIELGAEILKAGGY